MGRETATLLALTIISLCLMSGDKYQVAAAPVASAAPAKGYLDPASTHYLVLSPIPGTGQERFLCLARGRCHNKIISCPKQCPHRKPSLIHKTTVKACFADCSSRCETTCKHRIPNCNGYGSVCYDPRFVGGDGVMFYFHGANGGDFALVSDDRFQINVHFIGTRPQGRKRDYTWVQALSVMFNSHTLVIAARKVAKWDEHFDALAINWDGKDIAVQTDGDAEWRDGEDAMAMVERTQQFNSVKVTMLSGLIEMNVKVVPITKEDDKIHGYNIPQGDSFAHLETQFKFGNLTEHVEGILGQTYQPGYVSPVKKGVAMPMMGGEDRYRTSSLLSTECVSCRFHRAISFTEESSIALKLAQA